MGDKDIPSQAIVHLYLGYNQALDLQDVPKRFVVYFTSRKDWYDIVTETWGGHLYPFKIDTSFHNFPLNLEVAPMSREFYYPLLKTKVST